VASVAFSVRLEPLPCPFSDRRLYAILARRFQIGFESEFSFAGSGGNDASLCLILFNRRARSSFQYVRPAFLWEGDVIILLFQSVTRSDLLSVEGEIERN
jgi:hypothetical protein